MLIYVSRPRVVMKCGRRCRLTGVKVALCQNFCATRQQSDFLRTVQRLNGDECRELSEECQSPDVNKTAIHGRNLLFQEFQILKFEVVISVCMQVSFSPPFSLLFAREVLLLVLERFARFCLRHLELSHMRSRTATNAQERYVLISTRL